VRIVVVKYAFVPNRKVKQEERKKYILKILSHTRVVKVSIIIPAYNEAKTLATIVERVCLVALPLEKELIVIDDASTDGTEGIALELLHEKKSIIYTGLRSIKEKGERCARDCASHQEILCSFKMLTWNTRQAITAKYLIRF